MRKLIILFEKEVFILKKEKEVFLLLKTKKKPSFWLFSKEKFVNGNFGDIAVKVLDSNGNEVESWTLFNSFVSDINYSRLTYGGNNINTVTLRFSYDYATVNITEINQN